MNTKITKNINGIFTYTRNTELTEFNCDRCNSVKKSKILVKWKDNSGNEKTICNGCYGLLLSKEK